MVSLPIGPLGRNVARNLAALRSARRLTYTDLSARLAVADRPMATLSLRRIEQCERHVDVDDLAALARVLDAKPGNLLAAQPTCGRCLDAPVRGYTCAACGATNDGSAAA